MSAIELCQLLRKYLGESFTLPLDNGNWTSTMIDLSRFAETIKILEAQEDADRCQIDGSIVFLSHHRIQKKLAVGYAVRSKDVTLMKC